MYTVYVLTSDTAEKSYVGISSNMARRLREHNAGKHRYTKRYMPWSVLHTEVCNDRKSARVRERYFKSAVGRRVLKKLFLSAE